MAAPDRTLGYPVIIADDGASQLVDTLPTALGHAAIVYDRRVAQRAAAVQAVIESVGVGVLDSIGIVASERRKRMPAVISLHDRLLEKGVDRRSLLIAVGGGTLTDLAGFAASILLRGIPWLVVPTTILGMVDAAIGGKTGVNTARGKNLVGSFWDPLAVIADLPAIQSLPLRERRCGMAEIVKAGIIADPTLLGAAENMNLRAPPAGWKQLLTQAARVKVALVARDRTEVHERAALNLGHTVGHGFEYASAFRVSHGAAIAVGIRAAGLLALDRGLWSRNDHARTLRTLIKLGLPTHFCALPIDRVMEGIRQDKKRRNGTHRFVLPEKIGKVRVGVEVSDEEVRSIVGRCLSEPPESEWRS